MAVLSCAGQLDNREIAKKIKQWLEKKKFETKAFESGGEYVLKARKKGVLRATVGADRALEIGVRHNENQTEVNVRQGSWKTNAVSNAAWFVVTGSANLLISGWSIVIQKDLENYIRKIFEELGMKEVEL